MSNDNNSNQTSVADETKPLVKCKCGKTKGDPAIEAVYSYGTIALTMFMFGATPLPKRVDWKCSICKEVVESITDRTELKNYRYHTPPA